LDEELRKNSSVESETALASKLPFESEVTIATTPTTRRSSSDKAATAAQLTSSRPKRTRKVSVKTKGQPLDAKTPVKGPRIKHVCRRWVLFNVLACNLCQALHKNRSVQVAPSRLPRERVLSHFFLRFRPKFDETLNRNLLVSSQGVSCDGTHEGRVRRRFSSTERSAQRRTRKDCCSSRETERFAFPVTSAFLPWDGDSEANTWLCSCRSW